MVQHLLAPLIRLRHLDEPPEVAANMSLESGTDFFGEAPIFGKGPIYELANMMRVFTPL
jgi:hypothetical protein